MARVTVEDCIDKIQNRFELVMLAAQRARKIGSGSALTVERDNDKAPVISLREIAGQTISIDTLKEEMIAGYQRFLPNDDEEEKIDLMDGEKEWGELNRKASGIYAQEEFLDDEDVNFTEEDDDGGSEPSLGDIAGV